MLHTNTLKTNIVSDDSELRFQIGDLIYVRGELLLARSSQVFYYIIKKFTLFKIIDKNTSYAGYIKLKMIDDNHGIDIEFNHNAVYILINYRDSVNKMTSGIVEIKTKL